MYASTLQTLPPGALLRSRGRSLTDFVGGQVVTYRWGRDAIWWALEVLGIGRGDHVLLPASCCDVVLLPFIQRGVRISYYGLDGRLRFRLEEIEQKIEARTRAIYVIHYFGFPQDPEEIRDVCRRLGLRLIEDCAHALLGRRGTHPLGEFGDVAIFSLRKMLPVPDGGCLKVNDDRLQPTTVRGRAEVSAIFAAGKLVAYDLGQRGLLPIRGLKALWGCRSAEAEGIASPAGNEPHDQDMSAVSRRILAGLEPDEVAARRRAYFQYWLAHVPADERVKPLYSGLPEGIVPYSFPILVEGARELLATLQPRGLYLEPTLNAPWYGIPGLVNDEERFLEVENLAARLISLPVHQTLPVALLDRICEQVRKVL